MPVSGGELQLRQVNLVYPREPHEKQYFSPVAGLTVLTAGLGSLLFDAIWGECLGSAKGLESSGSKYLKCLGLG